MKISHVHEKQRVCISYLAETLINEMHVMSYLLLKDLPHYEFHNFLVTKNFIIKLTLGLFLRYFSILGDFHPDILIEAILIKKKRVVAQLRHDVNPLTAKPLCKKSLFYRCKF